MQPAAWTNRAVKAMQFEITRQVPEEPLNLTAGLRLFGIPRQSPLDRQVAVCLMFTQRSRAVRKRPSR